MINPRKLAAIDIVYLGSKLPSLLGGAPVLRPRHLRPVSGHSFWQIALGLYFISLGINYVPLLVYAVAITRGQSARAEMGDELSGERRAMARYRRQSILLLVPLLVPILGLARERPGSPDRSIVGERTDGTRKRK